MSDPNRPDAHPYLRRFRVDPSRVRVSLHRVDHGAVGFYWHVTISDKLGYGVTHTGFNADPVKAVEGALTKADDAHMPGIDLGCEWAYPHPQIKRP